MICPIHDPGIEARSPSPPTSPSTSPAPSPQQPHQLDLVTLLGHPHEQASTQPTTSFWHQYPVQHLAHHFYYPGYDFYSAYPLYCTYQANMSDAVPLIIGSGSKFGGGSRARGGSNFRGGPKFGNGTSRRGPKGGNPNRRPRKSVRVWRGNAEVGEIALGVFTRFSRKAKDAFPRHEAGKEVTKEVKAPASGSAGKTVVESEKKGLKTAARNSNGKTEKKGKKAARAPATASTVKAVAGSSKMASKEWADDDNTDEPIVVEGANGTSATNSPAKDTPPTHASTPGSSKRPATSSPAPIVPKNFYLHNEAWVQPKLPQLQHVLAWMETNKTTRHGESLMPLIPTPLETLSTTALVDIYAAVTAFDLTPFPHPLRHGILARLTQESVSLVQLQYFYDVLQEGDPIVSRLVTSVLEHYEAGNYYEQEYSDIYNWVELPVSEGGVDDNGYLKAHFGRVERSMKRKAREAQRGQSRVQGYEKLKSGFEAFAEPLREAPPSVAGAATGATSAKMGAMAGVTTTTGAAEASGETQEEKRVRRRNRRCQQRDSDGKAAEVGAAPASAGVKGVSVGGGKSAAGGKGAACESK